MKELHNLYQNILDNGVMSTDRTGVGTIKLIGQQMRFDLSKGFPAVTTKKLAWKAVVSELLWFVEGSHDERRLCEILHGTRDESKRTIWTDNYQNQGKSLGYTDGNLGPVYGKQWRKWEDTIVVDDYDEASNMIDKFGYELADTTSRGAFVLTRTIDQLYALIEGIKADPYGRRHILSAWNVSELDKMALMPCHYSSQFIVTDGKLNCNFNMRSQDTFLGTPFNIASYALLTHMIAQVCNLDIGELIINGGDCHIYLNHIDQVKEQLSREPKELPVLVMDTSITCIEDFTMDSFKLENYNPDSAIKAPMAI